MLQAPGQVGHVPVLKEGFDSADGCLTWLAQRFPGRHLRALLPQSDFVALALGAVAQHPVGRADLCTQKYRPTPSVSFLGACFLGP